MGVTCINDTTGRVINQLILDKVRQGGPEFRAREGRDLDMQQRDINGGEQEYNALRIRYRVGKLSQRPYAFALYRTAPSQSLA